MPEPILKPSGPAVIAVETPPANGNPEPFGQPIEELLTKAFEERDQAKAEKPKTERPPTTRTSSPSAPNPPAPTESESSGGPQSETKSKETEIKQPAKAAAQWKEVKEERDRLRAENEAFKAQQEKWKQWETERSEYDTVKRHRDELLARMETIALEKSPRFENHFKAKTDTAIALAKQAVGDSHAERVSKLLQLPDSDWRTEQLEAVMSELGPTRQSRLGAAIVEMDRINLERSTALAKSKEHLEAMQKADRDRVQSQKQEFERTFQDTLEKWSDPEKGLILFQKKDGDEAHNAEVAQRIETARNILNLNLSADQLSKAALWSAAAPGLLKNQMALVEERNALKAELEALKDGGPELTTGTNEASVDDDKLYEGLSPNEIVVEKIKRAGGWQK